MFTCSACGHGSPIKLGKCPACNAFGSFEKEAESLLKKGKKNKQSGNALTIGSSPQGYVQRPLHSKEFQRVFSSTIKQAGVYLLAGEPGIGKSTIVLQLLADLLQQTPDLQSAYFS
ncbi:MAG: hypothetical protein Q8O99_06795 [bacterium]|nr:hypothetical protein [bacterium]